MIDVLFLQIYSYSFQCLFIFPAFEIMLCKYGVVLKKIYFSEYKTHHLMKKINTLIAAAVLATCMSSCTKEGPAGPAGAAGTNGANGANGNANVKTYVVTLSPSNWIYNGTNKQLTSTVYVSGITQAIVDSGDVRVFMENTSQAGTWYAMPYTEVVSATLFSTYNYEHKQDSVRLIKMDGDYTVPNQVSTRKFKILVISSSGLKRRDVDWTDEKDISHKFNLE